MNRACRDNYKNQTPKGSLFTERKLWASERGVYAASPSLLLQLSLNSNLVGSFTLKRLDRRRAEAALWRAAKAERRAPTNRQLLDVPFHRGRTLTLPSECGRSPPAARRSVEVVWSIPEPFQLCSCGLGRSFSSWLSLRSFRGLVHEEFRIAPSHRNPFTHEIHCVVLKSVRKVSGHARVHQYPPRTADGRASAGP